MNLFGSKLYRIMEWITRMAYIQILWILFTLTGFVILGIFPSTVAMFAIVRDWLTGKTDIRLFSSYFKYFKADFWKSNLLGILITFIFLLISIDIYYIRLNVGGSLTWTSIPLFAFMLIFLLFLFYLFPVFVHFDLKITRILKNTFLIMLISPIQSFFILICLASLFIVMRFIPALAIIFGISAYAFITMWLSLHAIHKIESKRQFK
ncbi:YesL family protein [Halobacillus seohaensis]|uniref:YesL family protein n=1 Tax=Halobacillus seohaensis TaxID=447421 RepID=A0ABW2EPS9_9BACI